MRPWLLSLLLVGCAWEPQQHPIQGDPENVIAGSIVADGVDLPGLSVVFVTYADNPMPPTGTGRPATFSTVPGHEFTTSGGIPSAKYSVSGVPDGDFLVTGFMDLDEDFHPTVGAMAGATCGDIAGAHVADLETLEFAVVSVEGGVLLDNVTLTLGLPIPVERPAFYTLDDSGELGIPTVSVQAAFSLSFEAYDITTTAVHAAWEDDSGATTLTYDLDGPYEVQGPAWWDAYTGGFVCETAFFGIVYDRDLNGSPDEHPDFAGTGLGILDIWPRFGITYMGTPVDSDGDEIPDRFENDLDAGESWLAPGVVDPRIMIQADPPPLNVPFLTDTLPVLFLPAALHRFQSTEADCQGDWVRGQCEVIVQDRDAIPRGAWSITAIEETGQTWTVPSELAQAAQNGPGFNPATQYTWLSVED